VGWGAWSGLIWQEQVAGTCKLGNETLGSLNVGNFLTS